MAFQHRPAAFSSHSMEADQGGKWRHPDTLCVCEVRFLVAKDGSENHLINIHKNVNDYTVPYPEVSSTDSE
jgi:hypothetical protein